MRPVLTVIGEALVDLVDSGDHRTYTAHPGGSPLNVAVGLARLGHPTCLLARLASDAFGRLLREHAAGNGVDLGAAVRAREPSTIAVVSLDSDGRASYDFYRGGTADWQWTARELAELPRDTTVLHTGSLASWLSPGDALIAERARRARDNGEVVVSYDPNVRPSLLGTPEQARPLVERGVAAAHVVKASDEDVRWLYPDRALEATATGWLALGARVVVITHGGEGATAYRVERPPVHRPAPRISLADTVGAGDAFTAGLLGALADDGVGATEIAGLDERRLGDIVEQAVLVAALTCERAGADPPTRAEFDRRWGAQ